MVKVKSLSTNIIDFPVQHDPAAVCTVMLGHYLAVNIHFSAGDMDWIIIICLPSAASRTLFPMVVYLDNLPSNRN